MKETDNKTNAQSLPASNEKIQPVAPPITGKAKEKNLKKLEKTIDYSKIKEFKKEIESTLDILSGVLLTNKNLKKTKVVEIELSEEILAKYDPKSNKIFLNILKKKEGFNDNFVIALLHEYAHKIDVEFLGKGKGYGSELGGAKALMNSIEETETVRRLKNALKQSEENLKVAEKHINNDDYLNRLRKTIEDNKYLLLKEELFARAVTQHIVKHANREKILDKLSQRIKLLEQFGENDFKKILVKIKGVL